MTFTGQAISSQTDISVYRIEMGAAMSSAAFRKKGVKSTEGEAIESCFRRATRL